MHSEVDTTGNAAWFAGHEPADHPPSAETFQPPATGSLQASASSYLFGSLSRQHFGGRRVKAPAEHRMPVHTSAERDLLIDLWSQHGKKPGKDCMKLVLRDFNKCAIAQLQEYENAHQPIPVKDMLAPKDLKQLTNFIKGLEKSEEHRQAQMYTNAVTYLSSQVLNPESLATPFTGPTSALQLQPHPLPTLQPHVVGNSSAQSLPFGSISAHVPQTPSVLQGAMHLSGPSRLQPQANASAQPAFTHQDQPSRKRRRQQLAAQAKDNARTKQQRQHPGLHPGAAKPPTPPGPNSQACPPMAIQHPLLLLKKPKGQGVGERDPATRAEIVTCQRRGIPREHAASLNGMMTASLLSTKQRHQRQILLKRQDCPTTS